MNTMKEPTQEEIDAEVQKITANPQYAAEELIRLRKDVDEKERKKYVQYAIDLIHEREHLRCTFPRCSIQGNLGQ